MPVYISSALRNACENSFDSSPYESFQDFLKVLAIKENDSQPHQINKNQLNILATVVRESQNSNGLSRTALANRVWSAGEGEFSQAAFNSEVFSNDYNQLIGWGLLREENDISFIPSIPNPWYFDLSRPSQFARDSQGNFAAQSQGNSTVEQPSQLEIEEKHDTTVINEVKSLKRKLKKSTKEISELKQTVEELKQIVLNLNTTIANLATNNVNQPVPPQRNLSTTSLLSLSLGASHSQDNIDLDEESIAKRVKKSHSNNSHNSHNSQRSEEYNVPASQWSECNYGKNRR